MVSSTFKCPCGNTGSPTCTSKNCRKCCKNQTCPKHGLKLRNAGVSKLKKQNHIKPRKYIASTVACDCTTTTCPKCRLSDLDVVQDLIDACMQSALSPPPAEPPVPTPNYLTTLPDALARPPWLESQTCELKCRCGQSAAKNCLTRSCEKCCSEVFCVKHWRNKTPASTSVPTVSHVSNPVPEISLSDSAQQSRILGESSNFKVSSTSRLVAKITTPNDVICIEGDNEIMDKESTDEVENGTTSANVTNSSKSNNINSNNNDVDNSLVLKESGDPATSNQENESTFVLENNIEQKIYVHCRSSLKSSEQQVRSMIERFCRVVEVTLIDAQSACVELHPDALFHTYDQIYEFARNPINFVDIKPYAQYLRSK